MDDAPERAVGATHEHVVVPGGTLGGRSREYLRKIALSTLTKRRLLRTGHTATLGYITDTFGLRNLQYMGAERVLWSSDYPHISADWPSSWRVIQASMSGISGTDRELILAGNAQRLYGFGR